MKAMKKFLALLCAICILLSLAACGAKPEETGTADVPKIGIDGVTYIYTGRQVPVEPDESMIEYVEIPAGAAGTITAFARLDEGKMIVCLLDNEWCEFIAAEE